MVKQMPTFAEVRAYVLGVRLEQAHSLTFGNETAALHGSLLRLDTAASSIRHTAWGDDLPSRLIEVLRPAMRVIERQLTTFEGDRLDEVYLACRSQLEKMDAILCESASTAASDEKWGRWYDLGREITSGNGGDGTLPIKDPPPRRAWEWDHPEKLTAQIADLGSSLDMLFPVVPSTREWFEYVPLRWLEWIRIEAGIDGLMSTSQESGIDAIAQFTISASRQERRDRVIKALRESKDRMTAKEIFTKIKREYEDESVNMLRQELPRMCEEGVLDHASDATPSGYGLAEWKSL